MTNPERVLRGVLGAIAVVTFATASMPASAYIGPGAGITAIGTFFGVIGAVILMIVGFLWYPVKRMLRKRKQSEPVAKQSDSAPKTP